MMVISAGLKKLGINGGYEIVVADNLDSVENTAAEELRKFLGKAGVASKIVPESQSAGKKRFLLGRESGLKAIACLGQSGALNIRGVSAEDDGFHLKRIGEDVVVAGANPRGVLYGVYAFEEFVNAGADGSLDIKKVPYYRKRGSAIGYYHNTYANILTDDGFDERIASLARLGVNQWTSYDGFDCTLNKLVQSEVFPFQTPPAEKYQKNVKNVSAICKKYGIDYYLHLWEPILPRLAGDLKQYPEEALGKVAKPYGNPPEGFERTLCINSAIVQEHYRHMMKKLVREYPDVKGVFFYNMDGSTWICTPALCSRCKTACPDSPPNEFNPWESQALLVTLLAEAAHEVNPAFDFRFWGVHYHGERFDKLIRAARFDSLLSNWNASDHDVMIPDVAEPDPAFIVAREIAEKRNIPLFAYFALNNLECVPRSLPFPFHVCDALKKLKNWGFKYFLEVAGPLPGHNSINAWTMKEFQWNPDGNPEEFLTALSVRQFGAEAGPWMYKAWKEIEQAFDVWNDMPDNPLSGSHFAWSLGTTDGLPRPILLDAAARLNGFIDVLTTVEPHKKELLAKFKTPEFAGKMTQMSAHLAKAAAHAKQAVAAASGKARIDLCNYEADNRRPACKEYAELNYGSIAMADAICRQRCNMLRAAHLLMELEKSRTAGDAALAQSKESQYRDLVREDIALQEEFRDLLKEFEETRPVFTRTGLSDNEISDLLLSTRAKIDILKRSLESEKPLCFGDMPKNARYRFSWC